MNKGILMGQINFDMQTHEFVHKMKSYWKQANILTEVTS